jgi:signal transduction histidine kinase
LSYSGKKHLYLVTSDMNLVGEMKALENEYLISFDTDGRLLKRPNGIGKRPDIDLVITEFDFFVKKINGYFAPGVSANTPYFVVLVTPEQIALCASADFNVKYFPVFLPANAEQLQAIVVILLQNREKVLALEEKERYKILFQKAPMVQMLLNPCDLVILDANRAAADLYSCDDLPSLIGKPLLELHPSQSELLQKKLKEALRLGENQFTFTFDSAFNGSVDLVLFAGKISMGRRELLFVNIQDISDTKKAERILTLKNLELQKTNSELDNFVYSTSHELRAPLMSVLGLINLLEEETDTKEQSLYVGLMKESIQKLDQIIHDIIDYSRNARFEVNISPVDFSFLLEKTLNNLHYLPGIDRIEIRQKINQDVPFHSDKRRVEMILNNLVSNSLKFFNPAVANPYVEVIVQTSARQVMIRVEDNGRGIPEDHVSRIFEMFFRGYEQSTGSGIGLYIVKEIIEKLDGNIQVESVEGKGAVFTVTLPNQYQSH